MDSGPAAAAPSRWGAALPDLLAFAGGLAVAWFQRWETTDLIWSLWLSSLVVGYGMILWSLMRGAVESVGDGGTVVGAIPGVLFLLGFFTLHFGLFHFGHSVFLANLFPIDVVPGSKPGMPGPALYAEVVSRYAIFLPLAFLAERRHFPRLVSRGAVPSGRVARVSGNSLGAPYLNVVRMHLLIFFFAAAHFFRLENFVVYAVVYAVYFFPWRTVFGRPSAAPVRPLPSE